MKRLNVIENNASHQGNEILSQIISSYPGIERLYSYIRFRIIPLRFLQILQQYLPECGMVLDLGCGFGLFSLYFAMANPDCHFIGVDLNSKRIEIAQCSARSLNMRNVKFICQDVRDLWLDSKFNAIVCLDLIHHLPEEDGDALGRHLYDWLMPGGILLMKDVTTRPRWKLYFTFILDLLMCPRDSFFYREAASWRQCFMSAGFDPVYVQDMWDILPYPHMLLIGKKPAIPFRG